MPQVLIAGGGVAALEAALTLRALAEERVELELLAPEPRFWYRPLAVVEPFALGRVHGLELTELADRLGARFTLGALAAVDPVRHLATTTGGLELEYEALIVATGARPVPAVEGALTYRGPADGEAFTQLLREAASGAYRRLAFVLPGGVSWPLPLYELALMTAAFLAGQDAKVELAIVTPENTPLAIFGGQASLAVAGLLAARGIALHADTHPVAFEAGELLVAGGEAIAADRVVALPRIEGAPIIGLPRDRLGFIPTDSSGRVKGVADVFAAGDVVDFRVKQGGLAAQQAQAAAETIAAAAGADLRPQPFRPVLRGVLLTGSRPRYLRTELAAGAGEPSVAVMEPLWWPSGKIAGARLGPFLAEWAGLVLAPPDDAGGVLVDVELGAARSGAE